MSATTTHPTENDWRLAAVAAFPEAIVTLDAKRRVIQWNEAAEALTGRSAKSMLGQPFDVAVPAHLRQQFAEGFERAQSEPGSVPGSFEGRVLHQDGEILPVMATLVPTRLRTKFRLHILIHDIRAQVRAERRAKQLLAHLELLLRSIDSIVVSIDCSGRVTKWNHAAEQILGLPEPMVLGRRLDHLPLEWPTDKIRAAMESSCVEGPVRLDDLPFRTAAGEARVLGLVLRPLRPEGRITGCLITGADITERRGLEAQLRRAERMESIGQLAAGIAHEINTPIQFVGDNLRFLAGGVEDLYTYLTACRQLVEGRGSSAKLSELGEELELEYLRKELPRAIEQSLEGVGRVARIVRAMKELSHPPSEDMSPADINKALESATIVTRNEWKYNAQLELDLDEALPLVTCRINELSQVFLNLIVNAAHAVSARWGQDADEGRLKIRTRHVGPAVEVRVGDNGTGMTDEVRARCFDPFFTTKAVGRGTGQGLAITHAIVVEHHHGSVDLETVVGEGTTMILRIPIDPTSEEGSPGR